MEALRRAHVSVLYLPPGQDGVKVGADDYLAAGHTVVELEDLTEGRRPRIRPADPLVELQEAPPGTLRRPLALIDGGAYAATWLHVKETVTGRPCTQHGATIGQKRLHVV
jgi:hypothetical protein